MTKNTASGYKVLMEVDNNILLLVGDQQGYENKN